MSGRATRQGLILCCLLCGEPLSNSCAGDRGSGDLDAPAADTATAEPFLEPSIDSRLRYEFGDQDGLDEAHALTLRNRLGAMTRSVHGFQAMAEYEGVLALDRDSYRAASVHGPADKTVIADPESHELNQLWLSYTGLEGRLGLKVGRQAIGLGNERHVGMGPWRQNLQTFDAASITLQPADEFSVYYSYVERVNRNFGSEVFLAEHGDFDGSTHLFNATFSGLSIGEVTAFAYLMDLSNAAGDSNSNNSAGVSLSGGGASFPLRYFLEYALQTGSPSSPLDYTTHYAHAQLTTPIDDRREAILGMEYLGSDGGTGYAFPLGSKHKFNGFADQFTRTPAGGLADLYAGVRAELPWAISSNLVYHHYWDSRFDADFGDEIDLALSKNLGAGWQLVSHAAYFAGSSGYPDTVRASLELGFKF